MTALVRAELLKTFWTRGTWGLLAVAVLLVVARVELVLAGIGTVGSPLRGSAELTVAVLAAGGMGQFVVVLLGVVTVTREFATATWTSTLLTTPSRGRVLLAKVAAAAVVGVLTTWLLFAIAAARGLAAGAVVLDGDPRVTRLLLGGMLAAAFWAWFGVAVGALVRHQAAAVLVPLVELLVVETLLPSFGLGRVSPWTPGGATGALAGADFAGVLPVGVAVLVLLGYGLALTAPGLRRLVRSDVT
jgi:ABC-2 type transport system permease protein